ncbi:MAG: helix-turn-helix transcriptional regulator [Acidimicrobiales bacterium]
MVESKRAVTSSDLHSSGEDVWEVVQNLDLPLVLVELEHATIIDVTPAFLTELNLPPSAVLHQPVYDLFEGPDRRSAQMALTAITTGLVDFYRAHRRIRATSGAPVEVSVWVRALDFGERRFALAEYSLQPTPRDSPLVEHLGYTPPLMALGSTNADGLILSISNTARDILGVDPSTLIGQPLLTSDEVRRLCRQLDRANEGDGITAAVTLDLRVRLARKKGVRCIITSLAETTSRWFILISGPDPLTAPKLERTAQLEHRLWRIASEVQASGIFDSLGSLPDAQRFPQLNSLSTRQWEVLSRLLRGERVPTIASALYVSPSTVRSNLSDIFRIFQVHSQAELLEVLHE